MLFDTAAGSLRPIELLVGPYRSGKTSAALERVVEYCSSHAFEQTLIVVPSARYRSLLERRLLDLVERRQALSDGTAGLFGLRILPFNQVCELVLRSSGIVPRLLPEGSRARLISFVLEDLQSTGLVRTLLPIARLPGTVAAVLELIDEFQRAGLSPQAVLAEIEKTAGYQSRYVELARIYAGYWQMLEQLGYLDQRLVAFKARELLSAQRLPNLSFGLLLVDGFDRISRLQAQVIRGLAAQAGSSIVAFDFVDEQAAEGSELYKQYRWKEPSYRELVSTLAVREPKCWPAGDYVPAEVELFSAQDRFAEMDEIARRAKELIVRGGQRGKDLLVVARDLKAYRAAIEAAFDSAGLSYFVDESMGLVELPIVDFISRLLNLPVRDFPRNDVIFCLRSRYLKRDFLGLSGSDLDEIDNLSWQDQVVKGKQRWQYFRERALSGPTAAGLKRFLETATPSQTESSLTVFATWLEDVLDRLLQLPEHDPGSYGGSSQDHRLALIGIRAVIRDLVAEESIFGQGPVPYDAFVRRLDSRLEEANFRRQRQFEDAITVCGADLAPNRSFAAVFVAGLVEGEFPRASGQGGFVSREELRRWISFGVDVGNPRHDPGFEWALFRSLIERARGQVYLSFPRYEMTGEELIPSFFVTAGKSEAELEIKAAPVFWFSRSAPISARDLFAGCFWSGLEALLGQHRPEHALLSSLWQKLEEPLAVAKARASSLSASVYNGWLVDFVTSGALPANAPETWTASKLNDYGQCPFRFWVSHVLKWPKRAEPEAGLSARLLGETYHRALELFYRQLAIKALSLRAAEPSIWAELLSQAADQALAELEDRPQFHPGEFWSYEKAEIRFRLLRFAKEEARRAVKLNQDLEPARFEVAFGLEEPGSHPALAIDSEAGPILIRGRVDRIDLGPDCKPTLARVVDYKSGSTSISESDARAGRSIQNPLYALAVERSIIPGSRVLEAAYLSVSSGEVIGRLDFQKPEMSDLLKQTEDHVRRFVAGARRGEFTVRPNTLKVCLKCEHKKICRISELGGKEGSDEPLD